MEELKSFDQDLLNRKEIAVKLTEIIKNKSDLNVLAIDSNWGTGKTTFINMWTDMLEKGSAYKEDFEVMYFNSWENDYINEPLLSLLDELNNQIKDRDGKIKEFLSGTKENGIKGAKVVANLVMKIGSAGAVGTDDLKINDVDIFNRLTEIKNSKKELKEKLEKFQSKIDKKVIIFIDELDRCRPTYAIELLEIVKHIFDIDKYVFVISLDKEQLSHSIKTIYGNGMDSDGYLRRFFDLEYTLPNSKLKDYIEVKNKKVGSKYKNTLYIERFLSEIFTLENYSLRDVDKAYDFIELMLSEIEMYNTETNVYSITQLGLGYIYAYFINLKIKHNNLLVDIKSLNYISEKQAIEEKFTTFDFTKINLDFGYKFHKTQAEKVLKDIISLYLEVITLRHNNKHGIGMTDEEIKYFSVGYSEEKAVFGCEDNINLYHAYDQINALEKLDFLSNFNK
ncbi:MAG: KAP family P-loop NTPase fold protein [Sarcina sp.]